MIKHALRWMLCLCALASLASCGLFPPRPQVLTRPQVVEVPVPAYKPLPANLTNKLEEPAPPAPRCTFEGAPAICVLDALGLIPLYQAVVQVCNDDRAKAAVLSASNDP